MSRNEPFSVARKATHQVRPRLFGRFQKGNSPKFISSILHSSGPKGLETADSRGPKPNLQHYILWCCINMREVGCAG
jgi:hypothetical protein